MKNELNLLAQCNDTYAPFTGVMLTSLFENNKGFAVINVYLLISGVSRQNCGRLLALAKQYNRSLFFLETEKFDTFLEENHVPRFRNSYATYYKIFALSTIEAKLDRLIYLDSDIVITDSLKELNSCELGNHVAGMCIDRMPESYKRLIRHDSQFYHNAGMIVFNVPEWIGKKCTEQIKDHIVNARAAYPYKDQDLINVVLSGKIKTLPQKYNFNPEILWYSEYGFYKKAYGLANYYSKEEFIHAANNPVIIHCLPVFARRPWFHENYPAKEIWSKYLCLSPWKDWIYAKRHAPFVHKVQDFLFHHVSNGLFAFINHKAFSLSLWLQNRKTKRQSRHF